MVAVWSFRGRLTPLTSAPPPLVPLTFASAPPLRLRSDRCRLTSCVVPKEEDAGRFSPDIVGSYGRGDLE